MQVQILLFEEKEEETLFVTLRALLIIGGEPRVLAEVTLKGEEQDRWDLIGEAAAELFLRAPFVGNPIATGVLAKEITRWAMKHGYDIGYSDGFKAAKSPKLLDRDREGE